MHEGIHIKREENGIWPKFTDLLEGGEEEIKHRKEKKHCFAFVGDCVFVLVSQQCRALFCL